MNNDGPEPPSATPNVPFHDNGTDINQSQLPKVPDPPPSSALDASHLPEPITLLEKHVVLIHTLQGQNAKLYEDNCKLVNTVNMLNERLAFVGAPPNIQAVRFVDMQERLRATEAGRALISRKYQDLLQCTSPGAVQHHIMGELNAMREAYASLDRDYHILGDKYVRLKASFDASRAPQQQPQTARGYIPTPRPEYGNATQFRQHDQGRNSYVSPTSVISPGPLQHFSDQKGSNRRRSSESAMLPPSLRSGPAPIATTWLAPLPTPPPSAPMPGGQASPAGFPVQTPLPTGSLLFPHHPQMTHEPLALPGHPIQDAAEQPVHLRGEVADLANNPATPCSTQISTPATLTSSPRALKRPNAQYETFAKPVEEHKRARIEKVTEHPVTTDADPLPPKRTLSSPTLTDPQTDPVVDASVRSDQECVNLIFEKDANIENGVFCGLCFDRHEAKMIPEPPDVLIQPEFEFLVKHCMTMHPTVWDDLRRKA